MSPWLFQVVSPGIKPMSNWGPLSLLLVTACTLQYIENHIIFLCAQFFEPFKLLLSMISFRSIYSFLSLSVTGKIYQQ